MRNPSEQLVEAAVAALKKQKDPRGVPALRHVAQAKYDAFLKLSIADAQLALGDRDGFYTLFTVLKTDGAPLARQQASELLEKGAGKKFGYMAEANARQNGAALAAIEAWLKSQRIARREGSASGAARSGK
jgi:hypothetical protein